MRLVVAVLLVLAACRPPGWGQDGDDVAIDAGGDGDAPAAGDAAVGSDGPAATTCTKAFHLDGHGTATSVWLTGSFNAWAASPPGAIAFTQAGGGSWDVTHEFPAGLHQYKFIVSGSEWIADPTNPDGIDDGFGGRNSLYSCVPE